MTRNSLDFYFYFFVLLIMRALNTNTVGDTYVECTNDTLGVD